MTFKEMKKYILISSLVLLLICGLTIRSRAFDEPDLLEPDFLGVDSSQMTITLPNGTVIAIPMGEDEGFGGTIYNRAISFDNSVLVDGTEVIDGSGNWVGAITGTTGTFSSTLGVTGASTIAGLSATSGAFSTTLGVTGMSTLSDTLYVSNATSTVYIGDKSGNNYESGCLVLGDSGSATSSPVYITASGTSVSATTTKPSICK